MKYANIREEELKNKISQEYFYLYDCTKIIGNIDYCVTLYNSQKTLFETESFLWAEAKKGSTDIYKAITQLILTIGKARTYDKFLPPAYLGAFDAEKIAFVPYSEINSIFYMNDFNWNVAPSNHETKEFNLVLNKVKTTIEQNVLLFYYEKDSPELRRFIKNNFVLGKFGTTKTRIDKNNFITIYNKWLQSVKPKIAVNWEVAKLNGILDADFYLADLLSQDNVTLKEKLFVLLKKDHYQLDRKINEMGMFSSLRTDFTDKQVAHTQFWNKYERPPKEEYWDYIINRRDLLVPQDIRERKGSFFTPQIWVELSQEYLGKVLGEDWQDEYYIWDCAAGTGNLLAGLTNTYHIYASTLDKQDVDVMQDRIENGTNLLPEHVFQFDFLNDEFLPKSQGGKLPESLYKILTNSKKRRKLIIYINPPYAEATTARTVTKTGENKAGVSTLHKANQRFKSKIGNASNEVFALFMARVYEDIPNCILAQFSTLKFIQGTNFRVFKEFFQAKYLGGFVIPANTFDNVKGSFPIGFTIWDTSKKEKIKEVICEVYEKSKQSIGKKAFYGDLPESINKWIVEHQAKENEIIGIMSNYPPDFQNQNKVFIQLFPSVRSGALKINRYNLVAVCIYFSVRQCIEATWLNDRDQFLYPIDGWQEDTEFQNDCLAFTLFHGQNRISCQEGTNHWIPFTETQVHAKEKFESNFMSKFIQGKLKPNGNGTLYEAEKVRTTPLVFSKEAQSVFDAGLEIWKYYHKQKNCTVNASFYDIRAYFQGKNENGKMNSSSSDETYNTLITNLRKALEILAEKIEPKAYQYRFLKK